MLGIKVELKDAEKAKSFILSNDLMDKEYYHVKDKTHICFAVKQKFSLNSSVNPLNKFKFEFVDMKFPKSNIKGSLKDNLSKLLTEKEMDFVKTSHDTIGSIAIIEVPKDLIKKEKLIADTLIKINPQIKTVLKKAAIHDGVYRTQKLKFLAGVNTKETIYKENGVQIKLDVEKVYFSIRLSNERKRVSEQIKKNEEILVLFSGCAPYPLVLARNSKARHITGVEINPLGHKYGLDSVRLNNIHNITLVNSDVKKFSKNPYQHLIGLKCSLKKEDMATRLRKNPQIMEIHLFDNDLDPKNIPLFEKRVTELKNKGIEVFFHVPFRIDGKAYAIDNDRVVEFLKNLGGLCKKHFISSVIHLHSEASSINEQAVLAKVKELSNYYDYFYFETLTMSFDTQESIMKIAKSAGFKNICVDINHLYITYKNNKKIVSVIKEIQNNFNTYFHVADHDPKTHTREVGKGPIDFKTILPLVNKGVIEVKSKDESKPKESLNSYANLKKYSKTAPKKYDRIIMPAPHDAHKFLDDTLKFAKKGTIIHYYDFLELNKIDTALKQIEKACKKHKLKHKVLDVVKCGQHSPYVYRICVDFKIV
ncbi:MAG TPA: hypothetical protein VEC16_07080 [Alphaproteobacteria bacterium]|nr:hypothetical protein [Alphaproteobacteria bacterium]